MGTTHPLPFQCMIRLTNHNQPTSPSLGIAFRHSSYCFASNTKSWPVYICLLEKRLDKSQSCPNSANSAAILCCSFLTASCSRIKRSLLAALSSCVAVGFGDEPPDGRRGTEREGSMLDSSERGWFRIDEMALRRCGAGVTAFVGSSSGSMVALRLRFRGEGAPGCTDGWDVTLSLFVLR
jgi:hypothetical protein